MTRADRRRRYVVAPLIVVIAGVAVLALDGRHAHHGSGTDVTANGPATSVAMVTRRSLSDQAQVNGTLGYRGSYAVLGQLAGTVTWLPAPGHVIHDGQTLYRVDQSPVTLLYGAVPAYRLLTVGTSGADVSQLNHDLVALGDVERSEVDSDWREYNWATAAGVEELQKHLREPQTGALAFGEVVFLPTAARVTSHSVTLGASASGPILSATSTTHTVSVALDPSLQNEVSRGDHVTIILPDGSTAPGAVTSVGKVATVTPAGSANAGGQGGNDSGPTIAVQVRLLRLKGTGALDQALVEVAITDQTVRRVLTVPVTALVARAGGGYAVETVTDSGVHRLVAVTPGLFDDTAGRVQVSGLGLVAGQRVVVSGQ